MNSKNIWRRDGKPQRVYLETFRSPVWSTISQIYFSDMWCPCGLLAHQAN